MDKSILTKREKEVFDLLIKNKTTKEISKILKIITTRLSLSCLMKTATVFIHQKR